MTTDSLLTQLVHRLNSGAKLDPAYRQRFAIYSRRLYTGDHPNFMAFVNDRLVSDEAKRACLEAAVAAMDNGHVAAVQVPVGQAISTTPRVLPSEPLQINQPPTPQHMPPWLEAEVRRLVREELAKQSRFQPMMMQ